MEYERMSPIEIQGLLFNEINLTKKKWCGIFFDFQLPLLPFLDFLEWIIFKSET